MFYPEDQLKGQINSCERQLLWHIWQELQKLNARFEPKEEAKEEPCRAKTYICPVCKAEYENKGKFLACQRRHKREGK